jgi:hydroxyquinol 1,2-dioxygenase
MQSRNLADERLTESVRASFDAAPDRLRTVMDSLVRHLHAFASDVGLSEEEWLAGIRFLTETGQISDERRQEFILLSDVLGVSMLVIGLNDRAAEGGTDSTVFGPFFVEGAPRYENGDDLANGAPGTPCLVSGRVLSTSGEPVAGARVDVWQADEEGMYDVQYGDGTDAQARGHLFSGDDGRFWFRTVRPSAYSIPTDGPVGRLLAAAHRKTVRPAHIHFRVQAAGYETLTTHVFAAGDPYLDSDPVFGVKDSLIASFSRMDGADAVEYDFILVATRD